MLARARSSMLDCSSQEANDQLAEATPRLVAGFCGAGFTPAWQSLCRLGSVPPASSRFVRLPAARAWSICCSCRARLLVVAA